MVRTFIAVAAIVSTAVGTVPRAAAQNPAPAADGCAGAYVIGPDDVLDVSVWGNAEISRLVPVRPDGRISLPLLNDVQAAGLTPMQLRDAVTRALAPYMPEPAVSVLVREIHSVKVTVIGQVKAPGRYEIRDRATVLDVLAMAGGLNEFADRGGIAILRQDGGRARQISFAYDKLTSRGGRNGSTDSTAKDSAALNFCVKAGDVILVP
jgi:polysaccharide export outer membrane protein